MKLIGEIENDFSSEWQHGGALISESYFEEYAREMASDLGYLQSDSKGHNPLMECIDWKQWADLVKQDYSSYEIGDTTYWARS